jgi:hypothetical protein
MKMQRVTWIDSCTYTTWDHYAPGDLNPATCTSVGMRVPSSKGSIALAGSTDPCGKHGDVICIPRRCVKKIETLKVND